METLPAVVLPTKTVETLVPGHKRWRRTHKLLEEFRQAHHILFVFMVDGVSKLA
jgi:hypothetical protein